MQVLLSCICMDEYGDGDADNQLELYTGVRMGSSHAM